jgi:hypothetical protein
VQGRGEHRQQHHGRIKAEPDGDRGLEIRWRLDDRLLAAGAARWVDELEKILVDGTLPRSAIRTPDGSRYLREYPEMATPGWIDAAARRAKRGQGS